MKSNLTYCSYRWFRCSIFDIKIWNDLYLNLERQWRQSATSKKKKLSCSSPMESMKSLPKFSINWVSSQSHLAGSATVGAHHFLPTERNQSRNGLSPKTEPCVVLQFASATPKRPFLLFLLLFLNYTTIKRLFLQIGVCQTEEMISLDGSTFGFSGFPAHTGSCLSHSSKRSHSFWSFLCV